MERVLVEYLTRSRHDWTIFTNHFSPSTTFPEFKKFRVVELRRVPLTRTFPDLSRVAFTLLRQKLPLAGFDVLLVCTAGFGELVALRSRVPKAVYCFTPLKVIHDPLIRSKFLKENPVKAPLFHLFERTYRFFEKLSWKRFSSFACDSEEVKRRIVAGGLAPASQVRVIYPGIDSSKMKPSRKKPEKLFLVPGRIGWTKNLELAIDAFNEFQKSSPKFKDFRLVISGGVDKKSFSYLGHLRRHAVSNQSIRFEPNPSDKKYYSLYAGCFAVLFPAINEDWGIVPVEAMAFGKPVIAANQGGPQESVLNGKTGWHSEPSPAAFASLMKKLVSSPSLYRRFCKAAAKRAKDFDWNKFAQELDAEMEKLAGRT